MPISYELALALKEAGWKQPNYWDEGDWVHDPNKKINSSPYLTETERNKLYDEEYASSPTLSELIEACGETFHALVHIRIPESWAAEIDGKERLWGEGDTPEEAVANLWLKLNGKNT